jgi:DNA-3-methyladenine glycosylase II
MKRALDHLTKKDPVLGGLIRSIGAYRIEYSPAEFSTIVRCILYQQVSRKVGLILYNRLAEAAGNRSQVTPPAVLSLSSGIMRGLGLSLRKIEYIREFAEGCDKGEIDLGGFEQLSDEEILQRLTRRRGIGPWTAHMYMIFALGRLDVLPVGDLGVRVAVRDTYNLERTPSPQAVEKMGRIWRPYATVATWYLWRSLGDGAGLDP